MSKDSKILGKVVQIDEARIQDHQGRLARGTVEETLNSLLEAEAARTMHALEDTKLDKSAELVAEKICETLTYYRYPQTHWTCIRTSDPLERNIREIRPHIRVVGAFPDGQSPLMPVAARLRYVAGTKCGTQHYFLSIDALGEYAKLSGN